MYSDLIKTEIESLLEWLDTDTDNTLKLVGIFKGEGHEFLQTYGVPALNIVFYRPPARQTVGFGSMEKNINLNIPVPHEYFVFPIREKNGKLEYYHLRHFFTLSKAVNTNINTDLHGLIPNHNRNFVCFAGTIINKNQRLVPYIKHIMDLYYRTNCGNHQTGYAFSRNPVLTEIFFDELKASEPEYTEWVKEAKPKTIGQDCYWGTPDDKAFFANKGGIVPYITSVYFERLLSNQKSNFWRKKSVRAKFAKMAPLPENEGKLYLADKPQRLIYQYDVVKAKLLKQLKMG